VATGTLVRVAVPDRHRGVDEALADAIRSAQYGDMLAMHDVLDAVAEPVRRWCGPIALQDSADAVQETLVIVLRRLGELREPAALFGWVRTIAVREAIRVARHAARTVPYELDDIPAPGDPALTVEVHDVLAQLSPEHRAVLMLRDMDGFDEPTAAAVLSVPEGTVRSRLFRARQAFRRLWQADGGAR
jgi:RNA polymerase sigma-70 factor (ECF subfamily)